MIKRLTVAVAALFMLATQSFGAGTIPYSLSQQRDEFGTPLAGCLLYTIQAGTTSTPQSSYQDSALTLLWPNPLVCDSAGRLPQFFLADGSIKVRLTKSNGVTVVTADGILVVGASSGGGGGSPVDATTVLATGDIKSRYGTGVLSGFVRMNGRTIGSATAGATERANADAQTLYEYLWTNDANLSVSGGRGASANADWTANKTITLPDARGRALMALPDMGNSAASTLTNLTCLLYLTLGAACGGQTQAIAQANMPSYTLPNTLAISSTLAVSSTLGISDPGHSHTLNNATNVTHSNLFGGGSGTTGGTNSDITVNSNTTGITLSGGVSLTGSATITGGVTSGGSGTAFGVLNPVILITTYIKL
jgi:hypothetical protein